jgi:hypothetical protein
VKREFRPGFRFSLFDGAVILLGATAMALLWQHDLVLSLVVGFVLGHFFLFCNVLRMSRSRELVWAFAFVALFALSVANPTVTLGLVFATSILVTIVLAAIEMRSASYHGVAWKVLNPSLESRWNKELNGTLPESARQ